MIKDLIKPFSIALLVVAGSAFFFVSSSLAYEGSYWIDEQFEDTSSIKLYNSDSDYSYPFVYSVSGYASIASDCYTNNCVKIGNTYNAYLRKSTNGKNLEKEPNILSFKFKQNNAVTSSSYYDEFSIGNWSTGLDMLIWGRISSSSKLTINTYSPLSSTEYDCPAGEWHEIKFKYDYISQDDNILRLFYQFDNYAWVQWTMDWPAGYIIEYINYTTSRDSGHYMYIDDFDLYYSDPLGLDSDTWELTPLYPDFNAPNRNICFIGEDCDIEIRYNDRAISGTLYFIHDIEGNQNFPEYASSSIELTDNSQRIVHFTDIEQIGSSTEQSYCLYLVIDPYLGMNELGAYPGYYEKVACGFTNVWVNQEDYEMIEGYVGDVCDTVASSTGSFADDMRYGVECGIRRIGYFFFTPSQNSIDKLSTINQTAETIFPYSLFVDAKSVYENSSSTLDSFDINFTQLTGIDGFDNDIQLVGNGTVSWLGDLWDKIYFLMETIIYVLAFFYFSSLIISWVKNV